LEWKLHRAPPFLRDASVRYNAAQPRSLP
jgi:hypothetical protein